MVLVFAPVLLWAAGSLATARAVRVLGPAATNRRRLLLAVGVLSLWVAIRPGLPSHRGVWLWLLVSGAVGLGLGDLAMLAGYRRIGPRLGILLVMCLAVPITAWSEWIWLGTPLGATAIVLLAVLLTGVALAIWPVGPVLPANRRQRLAGISFGVLAAFGQGLSTTLSRMAYSAAEVDGVTVTGISATWQRMLGGLVCTLLAERVFRLSTGQPPIARAGEWMSHVPARHGPARPALWVALSALCGPILGLSAYQAALIHLPGAIVQAVATLTPVAVIPLAWVFDGDRPGWRGLVGGAIACAAAAALVLTRT